jgi:GT2 family glycosyltransferase
VRRVRIAQFGTFDVENYGDLLFPLVARARLADLGAEIVPVSPLGSPAVWGDCLPSVGMDGTIGHVDAVLLGGGNIVHGRAAGVPTYRRDGLTALLAYVGLWSGAARLAEERGVPLLWNAPGVPARLDGRLAGELKRATAGAAYLNVRDHSSRLRLEESGVRAPMTIVPDTALDVSRLWSAEELDEAAAATIDALAGGSVERLVAVHLNRRYLDVDHRTAAGLLDDLAERQDARVVLLGLGPCHGDDDLALRVAAEMRSVPLIVPRPASQRQVAALIRRSTSYLGSSLHGYVTACAFGVPGVLLASPNRTVDGKFPGFLDHVGVGDAVAIGLVAAVTALDAGAERPRPLLDGAARALDEHWATIRAALAERPEAEARADAPSLRLDAPVSLIAEAATHLLRDADAAPERAAQEALAAERETMAGEREAMAAELEATAAELATVAAEREATEAELARIAAERDATVAELAMLAAAREATEPEREAMVAQREAMLAELAALRAAHARELAEAEASVREADQRAQELERRLGAMESAALHGARELRQAIAALEEDSRAAAAATAEARARADAVLAAVDDNRATFQRRLAQADERTRELEKALSRRDDVIDEVLGDLVRLDALTEALEASRSWRLGHGLMMLARRLTFRRFTGQGAAALVRKHAERAASTARAASTPLGLDGGRAQIGPGPQPAATLRAGPLDDAARVELAGGRAFRRRLEEHVPRTSPLDPPRDHHGLVVASHEGSEAPTADVVVCVHDALADVDACLRSLLTVTEKPFGLIVVDDHSGPETRAYLERFAAANAAVRLVRTPAERRGYTVAANVGLRASSGDYVVLLNSDTVVTRGWLRRLLAAGESDPTLGILGPLSNAATHQSVPHVTSDGDWSMNELPAWATSEAVALALERLGGDRIASVPFVNGFCFVIRRAVVDAIGLLDEETFGEGYAEENDYSLRTAAAGFGLGVVCSAYVEHRKSRSYGPEERDRLAKAQYRKFLDKHGDENVRRLVGDLQGNARLAGIRERLEHVLAEPAGLVGVLPALRVTFVLPGLAQAGSGGSHSLVQEARALGNLGIEARIAIPAAAMDRARTAYPQETALFAPVTNLGDVRTGDDGRDVLVATHWRSVAPVLELARHSDALAGYYVQDYEPLFEPAGSPEAAEAAATYDAMAGEVVFAKTPWLCELVTATHGVRAHLVEPSIDPFLFHPEGRVESPTVRLAAMVRPRTDRRAAATTLGVLVALRARFGDSVEITTFGCPAEALSPMGGVPPGVRHLGLLDRSAVADVLRRSDVFVDCSWYQAFGRTALEAMACGATAVAPLTGGASSFVVDGHNGRLVDTLDPAEVIATVALLVERTDHRRGMQAAAAATGAAYSPERAALSQYVLFAGAWLDREQRRRDGTLSPAGSG